MSKKKYSRVNVPMVKTIDPEDRMVIDSMSIETTFDPEGTLTFNKNNGVLTWNSGDITHLNFTGEDFMILFDAESGLLTLTAGDKNIYYELTSLKEQILEKGLTVEEMEKLIAEEENKNNNTKGDD